MCKRLQVAALFAGILISSPASGDIYRGCDTNEMLFPFESFEQWDRMMNSWFARLILEGARKNDYEGQRELWADLAGRRDQLEAWRRRLEQQDRMEFWSNIARGLSSSCNIIELGPTDDFAN